MKRHSALIALAVLSVPTVAEARPDCMTLSEARAAHPQAHLYTSHGCWSDSRRTTAQKPPEQSRSLPPASTEVPRLPPKPPVPSVSSQPVPPQPQAEVPALPQAQVPALAEPQIPGSPPDNPPSNPVNPATVEIVTPAPAQLRADVFQSLLGSNALAHEPPPDPPSSFEQRWETPRDPLPKEKKDVIARLKGRVAPVPVSQAIDIDKVWGIGLVVGAILVGLGLSWWISPSILSRALDRLAEARHWLMSHVRSGASEPGCEPLPHGTADVRLLDDTEIRTGLEKFAQHHFGRRTS